MTAKSKTCPVCGGEDRFYFHYTAEHPHWRCRACQYTAEPTGEDLEGKPDRDPLTPEQQQQARAAYATVATYCADKLWTPEGKPARDYLHQRGFTDETLKAAGIGWHHDDRRNGVALDL
jgi:rubredoxin